MNMQVLAPVSGRSESLLSQLFGQDLRFRFKSSRLAKELHPALQKAVLAYAAGKPEVYQILRELMDYDEPVPVLVEDPRPGDKPDKGYMPFDGGWYFHVMADESATNKIIIHVVDVNG